MGRGGLWGGGGRLLTFSAFRIGANSRLGTYSNKYGISFIKAKTVRMCLLQHSGDGNLVYLFL